MNKKEQIEELYHKDTFSDKDSAIIGNAIDNYEVYTDDLKESFMSYAYDRLEKEYGDKFSNEEIWSYTDENVSNGRTHKENYEELAEWLSGDFYKQ